MARPPAERRRRLIHRALPALAGLALASLAGGALVGSAGDSETERRASSFGAAWERGDYRAMHRLLTPASRRRISVPALRGAYRRAAATATALDVRVAEPAG
ncbi:MAG TPA: hypothetical protein VEQ61_04530, partial [Thermoleophilaceae bacterium]|nr:hypothetical protein [Thermoleophilaceae bacterium]